MSTLSDTCCLNRYSGASADDGWQKQREMPGRNRLIDKSLYCVSVLLVFVGRVFVGLQQHMVLV
jgi:hypothetical protein